MTKAECRIFCLQILKAGAVSSHFIHIKTVLPFTYSVNKQNGICFFSIWSISISKLAEEDGPWDMIFRIRKQLGQGFLGSVLDCFYCLSIWIAIPFAIWTTDNWKNGIIYWLAISGGACVLYKATSKK